MFAVFGGGNSSRVEYAPALFQFDRLNENVAYRPEYDMDLAPAPVVLVAPQIEATPTAPLPAAAIAPTVTAAGASSVNGCPAVIVETFGEHAPAACAVAWCESRFDPHAVGDGGRSLGWFQLWTGWAAWYGVQVDALFDPATNAAVARAVFEYRGRWGGAGGWTCADLLGIW